MATDKDGLTPKQVRFVEEYLIDLNGKQAAIRAGYSPGRAESQASTLLATRKVSQAVAAGKAARSSRTQLTQDLVLESLRQVITFDIRRLYRPDGSMKLPHELDDETAAALSSLETVESGAKVDEGEDGEQAFVPEYVRKAKALDKIGALTLAMRHLGMLNDKLKIEANVTGGVRYEAAMPKRDPT